MITRRRLAAASAALLVLALAPVAAADPCDDSLATCDFSQSSVVVPMDLDQLTATIDVTDRNDNGMADERALIDAILPEGYAVPARPQVALQIVELYSGRKELGARYGREGSVAVSAVHTASGEEGWFHLSTPTDSQTAYDIGRPAGLPKTMMDSMTFDHDGERATASATLAGRTVFSMGFAPTGGPVPGALRDWTLVRDAYLLQNPPLEGGLYRLKYTVKPYLPLSDVAGPLAAPAAQPGLTALPEPRAGLVQYAVDPRTDAFDAGSPAPLRDVFPAGSDLSDLIPEAGTALGAHVAAPVLLMIQQRDL